MEYNRIRLLKGSGDCSKQYDTILGNQANPEVLKVWDISEKESALTELKNYRCKAKVQRMYCCAVVINEEVYALQFCKEEADGSLANDCEYTFAEGNTLF